jgi:3-oxoacyl-[acyl-carrier protein] reductase
VLLKDRTAIVHGASGSVGSAVARAFAREGAEVHLTGRTLSTLEEVANAIRDHGRNARVAELDAVDRDAVERHAAQAAEQKRWHRHLLQRPQQPRHTGRPLLDMRGRRRRAARGQGGHVDLHVATAAARHMDGRGVILAMGGGREAIPKPPRLPRRLAALAGLCRQLAAELGPQGIRVAWLLSPGSPDPGEGDPEADGLLLPRRPNYDQVANAARLRLRVTRLISHDQQERSRTASLSRRRGLRHAALVQQSTSTRMGTVSCAAYPLPIARTLPSGSLIHAPT